MEPLMSRRSRRVPAAVHASGAVLIIALVVLALMSLAAASVIRSTDTGTLVAGNLAFRQATTHASDVAVDRAWEELVQGTYTGKAYYYGTRQTASPDFTTAAAVASAVVWDSNAVPCTDERGMTVDCAAETGGFRIQYLIERQCETAPDVSDVNSIKARCAIDPLSASAASPGDLGVFFRVLVRARGPRGTVSFYEVMYSGPAA
ncbi:hypothetical protein GPA27_25315 [Aromatoleum toluolicum]|nr:hypothetical protein [Aromatoleum toluolicum]NMG00706.2 hypothetical protein [Aromatoleum toluolicum]